LIDVEMPDKTTINVAAVPTMTIRDFKNIIEDRTGVPNSRQRVFLMDIDDDELRDTVPMSMLNTEPGKGLKLRYPEIQVRPPPGNGTPFVLYIDPDDDTNDTNHYGYTRQRPPLVLKWRGCS
jgi:Ubiquitin family